MLLYVDVVFLPKRIITWPGPCDILSPGCRMTDWPRAEFFFLGASGADPQFLFFCQPFRRADVDRCWPGYQPRLFEHLGLSPQSQWTVKVLVVGGQRIYGWPDWLAWSAWWLSQARYSKVKSVDLFEARWINYFIFSKLHSEVWSCTYRLNSSTRSARIYNGPPSLDLELICNGVCHISKSYLTQTQTYSKWICSQSIAPEQSDRLFHMHQCQIDTLRVWPAFPSSWLPGFNQSESSMWILEKTQNHLDALFTKLNYH